MERHGLGKNICNPYDFIQVMKLNNNNGQRFEKHFTKEDIWMAHTAHERMMSPLVTREVKIKITEMRDTHVL